MTSLTDDIVFLRKRGEPDTDILSALQRYQPNLADDIETLLKRGEDPTKVLDQFAAYSDQAPAAPDRSLMGALRHGVASTLGGEAETLRQTTGDGAASSALDMGANTAKPDDYTPADASMGRNATWGKWARALPYAVAESLPGTGQDLAAGAAGAAAGSFIPVVGTTLGAALGFGGSYLARSYGSDVKANVAARTGDANATPSDGDKARALAQGVAGAALSRIGLGAAGGSVVKAVGGNLVRDVGSQVARGAAADAATSVGADTVHQALTPGNAPLDGTSLLNAAATGAVTGGGLRLAKAAADVNNAAKFSDIDPTVGQRLAGRFADEDTSSPSASFGAIANVKRDLGTEVQRFAQDAGSQIRDLQSSVGSHDDTQLMVAKAQATLKAGQPLDPEDLDTLGQRLGTHQEGANLMSALAEHSALNQVVQAGTMDNANQRFGGGLASNPLVQHFIKPFGKTSLTEAGAATAIPALLGQGFRPEFAAGTLGAQVGLYGAMSGVDHLLGSANPLDQFAQRFAPDSLPQSIMASNAELPSFRQPGPQGGGGPPGGGPTAGPSGAPPAGISPSPMSPPSPGPQGQSTSPAGSPAAPSPAPGPGPAPVSHPSAPPSPAAPMPPGGPRPATPSPQLALAMARLMSAKAKPGKPEPTPIGPSTAPIDFAGGVGPTDGAKAVPSPQAALARLLLAQRAQVPEASGAAQASPSPLAVARAMNKVRGDAGGARGRTSADSQPSKTRDGKDYHHDPANGKIVVSHKDHTVVRDLGGVQRVGDYATATHRNLVVRQQHFDAVAHLAEGVHDKAVLTSLHHALNQRSKSWEDATSHIQEAVEEKMQHTDWDNRAAIAHKLLEPRMRGTWTK